MDRWSNLNMQQKAKLLGIYASKGYTDLASIINHYNTFQAGGSLGKITPLGQWEYPHQVTTIPSNNITMKGVDYPVLGVSDTGDTKYMLPNMDYLFDGQYVTEYPLHKFQKGGYTTNGRTLADGRTLYPISDLPAEDTPTSLPAAKINLKPVTVTAKHPLWNLPDYQGKEGNPNINAHKDELYQNRRRREEAGKTYLKSIANIGSVMSLPIGGAAGFFLNLPDAVLDITSEHPIAEELLDAPTRALAEIDNGKIGDKVEKGLYSVPKVGKIIGPAYTLWRKVNDVVQPLGATNDATDLFTGESGIEKILK